MALHARFARLNRFMLVLLALCLAPAVFTVDDVALTFGLATVGFVQYGVLQTVAPRFRRPEVWLFWSLMCAQACICAGVTVSGLAGTGALGILLWPASGLASRFPTRVVVVGTAFTVLLLIAGFAFGAPDLLRTTPVILSGYIGVTVAVVATVSILRLSDVAHHNAATVDQLTGLPNRVALQARADELEAQRVDPDGIALVLLDIDHFKRINDAHGHQAGDDVLVAFGQLLREVVRGHETYRIGGEEFAVLAPGFSSDESMMLAERLLRAIRQRSLASHQITVSAGIGLSSPDEPVSWKDLFAEADAALYRAKREGRDRARLAGDGHIRAAA